MPGAWESASVPARGPRQGRFHRGSKARAAQGCSTFPQPLAGRALAVAGAQRGFVSPARGLLLAPLIAWLRAGTPRAAPSSRRHLPTPLRAVPGFSSLFSLTRLSILETAAFGAVSRVRCEAEGRHSILQEQRAVLSPSQKWGIGGQTL